ncbi:MAG: hypothetical protein IJA51_00590 [Oscillospiraceae bacterium]|nr:hypothetical protein [Oscillospiraceae bacterium]
MKQSSPLFRVLSIAVVIGVLAFFGVQLSQYFSNPLSTTLVYAASTEDALVAEGWIVRDEESFHTEGTLIHHFREGEKVGMGQTLATAYGSAGALETVGELEEKELQLEQLEFALTSYLDTDAALKLDSSIMESLLLLRSDLADGDYATASENISQLKSDILKRDHPYSDAAQIQEEISAVKKEISSLRNSLSGAKAVRADEPGTYSAMCDGYETVLTPKLLAELTPSMLSSLLPKEDDAAVGKLIYGSTWYFAAVLEEETVSRLYEDGNITVRFSKGLQQEVVMPILSVSQAENGKQVVVFSSDEYLAQITTLRRQSATLILDEYSGLRIPANALRMNQDGQTGVYCLVGHNAEFKPVDVVYRGEGYTLVRPSEGSTGGDVLRSGDEVIVTAGELFDGKVVL